MSADEVVPLGSITKWLSGGTPDRSRASYWNGSIPWISAATLKSFTIQQSDQAITKEAVRAGSRIAPVGSTLILVRGMSVHQEVRAGVVARPVAFNQDVKALLPAPCVDSRFLAYSLRAREAEVLQLVTSAGSGTGVLETEALKRLPVSIPPLPQQVEIVRVLDNVEDHILTLRKLAAKKQAIKQGMIQRLLTGAVRLPGFGASWSIVRLGSLLKHRPRYGINAAAVPHSTDTPAYIRITDIDNEGHYAPQPKVGVRNPNASAYLLRDGELVFARTGASVGKSYLYDPRDGTLVYAGFLINLAPDPEVLEPRYLALYAQTAQYWDWVSRTSVRSGQPGLNGREYSDLQLPIPEVREQRAIVAALQDIDLEISLLRRRLSKAVLIKQGMMQQLLTRRTRLKMAEEAA